MLQAYLALTPAPGQMAAVVEEYRRAQIIEASFPYGLTRGEAVIVPGDGAPDRLFILSLWKDQAAYDSWLNAPERAGVTVALWPLLTSGAADSINTVECDEPDDSTPLPLAPIVTPEPAGAERVITVRV